MPADLAATPDALVLAAGGVLGEAWMTGVLAGIEDSSEIRFATAETFVGTSAGSIVAAGLASGEPLRGPRDPRSASAHGADGLAADARSAAAHDGGNGSGLGSLVRSAAGLGLNIASPLVAPALALGAPGGALLRAAVLSRVPSTGQSLGSLRAGVFGSGAQFDGRLRVVCVDRSRGRRVVFGAPGAPRANVAEAVAASCSVPWMFKPVRIGGRDYVDGGVWSLTNLDVTPVGSQTRVLCLNVSAPERPGAAGPLDALRSLARAAAAAETVVLRRRGAEVQMIGPSAEAARAIGPNLMDPGRREQVLAAGYLQGREVGGG
jgi:NTE family protein